MKCKKKRCANQASHASDVCAEHENSFLIRYTYEEWDEAEWKERKQILGGMWSHDAREDIIEGAITDLITHAHDISK